MKVINDFVVLKKLSEESSVYVDPNDRPDYFKGEVIEFDENINFLKKGDVVLYDPVYIGYEVEYNNQKCVVINKEYLAGRERD